MQKPIFNLVAPEKPIEPCDSIHNSKEIQAFKNAKEFVEFAIKFEQENPDAVSLDFDCLFDYEINQDIFILNWFVINTNYKEEYAKYLLEMEKYNKIQTEYQTALDKYKADLTIYDNFVSLSKIDKAKQKLIAYEDALNYINTNESVQVETLVKILNSGNK